MTHDPELREPDLPRTAKVRKRALRTGWTTGTCAAAAAKAAAAALSTGQIQHTVEVGLPDGRRVRFAVDECTLETNQATAVVVKDAGDDPDVTHGARLTATVRWCDEPGLQLDGGVGVGVVTKPGLGLEVGAPAINPVPRQMITQSVGEAVDLCQRDPGHSGPSQSGPSQRGPSHSGPGHSGPGHSGPSQRDPSQRDPGQTTLSQGGPGQGGHSQRGLEVIISVPDGERMARKTTNARLGIIGGISILGTTGIVRPFSTASWRASVEQAISVLAAQGEDTVVLCTGGRTEKGAMKLLPDLPEVCFVEVGDFTGAALRQAVNHRLKQVIFAGMVGKLTKLAAGILMTHYTRSKVDLALLQDITLAAGGSKDLAGQVAQANTARHAAELWDQAGILPEAGRELCARAARVLSRFSAELAGPDADPENDPEAAPENDPEAAPENGPGNRAPANRAPANRAQGSRAPGNKAQEILVFMVDFTGQAKIAEATAEAAA